MIARRPHGLLTAAVFLLLCPAWIASQAPKTEQIMALATRSMEEFVSRFSNVVAEERYVQEANLPQRRRELRSDFLLVKPPGSNDWLQFRDVFEVDGKPIRDRQDRLSELFLRPAADALARAAEVTRESARYNLVDIGTVNRPLTVVAFLQPRYQDRFRFWRGSIDTKVGAEAWLIQYEEWKRPTILRNGQGHSDLPAHGRLWIDGATGRVLRTQLLIGLARIPDEIVTSFQFDRDLQVNVPVEMRERYDISNAVVTGVATYSRFRRYQVHTDESVR
jgi:hypothetical protein